MACAIQVSNVWISQNHHLGFTDLIRYNNQWVCAFRRGASHMSLDSQLIILVSDDAKIWRLKWQLTWQGGDLRDPKLSITPNHQLLLTAGIRWAVPLSINTAISSVGYLLEKGGFPEPVLDATSEGTWRWAPTWHQGVAYSVGYAGKDKTGCLYQSCDGLHWQRWVKPFFMTPEGLSNEATLAFAGNRAYCLLRRDKKEGVNALLGESAFPFKEWQWQETNQSLGGPKLLHLSSGQWIAGFREIDYEKQTACMLLKKLNPKTAQFSDWITLPSSGDCSYPGLVEYDGHLLVSYYSSHEDQVSIYLADIELIRN